MAKPLLDRYFKIAVVAAIILFLLHELRTVLAPFFLAIFLALLIFPFAKQLESLGTSRWVSALISMLLSFCVTASLGVFGYYQLRNLLSDLNRVQEILLVKANNLFRHIPETLLPEGLNKIQDLSSFLPRIISLEGSGVLFGDALSATTQFASMVFLLPVYIFFILLYRRKFVELLKELDRRTGHELWRATLKAKGVAQHYLAGLGLVVFIVAVLNTLGLWALDIRYALLLGVVSAMLTVIPYVGTILGAIFPTIIALATKDSYWYSAGVVAIYAFVQFLEGNFITPHVVGRSVNINPLAAILSLFVAGQFWGIIGMIIAVPTVAMLDILFQHIPSLSPLSILLRHDDP